MKILEAQSAVLTNYEVYQFLIDQRTQYQKSTPNKRKGPGNLETLRRELIQYFEQDGIPLGQKPSTYTASAVPTLLEKLRPYDITKGETIMIFNLRPTNIAALNTVIEDMESRFTPEQQEEIVNDIIDVLGQFPPKEDTAAGEDATPA